MLLPNLESLSSFERESKEVIILVTDFCRKQLNNRNLEIRIKELTDTKGYSYQIVWKY